MQVLGHRLRRPVAVRLAAKSADSSRREPRAPAPASRLARSPPTCAVRSGRSLIAHLRGHFRLAGDLGHAAGFPQTVRQRLLAINSLPFFHGADRRRRVRVVGRAHRDGVDLSRHLVEQVAKVIKLLGVGKTLRGFGQFVFVDVANRHDLAQASGIVRIAVSFAPHSDTSKPHLVRRCFGWLRGRRALFGGRPTGNPIADAERRSRLDETAPRILETRTHVSALLGW